MAFWMQIKLFLWITKFMALIKSCKGGGLHFELKQLRTGGLKVRKNSIKYEAELWCSKTAKFQPKKGRLGKVLWEGALDERGLFVRIYLKGTRASISWLSCEPSEPLKGSIISKINGYGSNNTYRKLPCQLPSITTPPIESPSRSLGQAADGFHPKQAPSSRRKKSSLRHNWVWAACCAPFWLGQMEK